VKRPYEITFILPSSLADTEQKAMAEKVAGWIKEAGGEVKNINHWGRRRLAYPIGSNREGFYVLLEVELAPSAINDFQRKMNIDANIIRYLVVRTDE
jgi:small subunit ribosomal protein S6